MDAKGATADERIARIAARQHGVVSSAQLREVGVGRNAVRRRVEAGRLHRLHRGVYAVGHLAPSRRREGMAAVLACRRAASGGTAVAATAFDRAPDRIAADSAAGTVSILGWWGAALSHRSAAQLWELLPARDGPIDVSIPGNGGKRRRRGIRVHRSVLLLPTEVTLRSGIPVTTAARTISDLRRSLPASGGQGPILPWELRRAIRQAEVLGLPLDLETGGDRTRSDLERAFLRLCRHYRLPVPEVNVRLGAHLVDFLWRDRMLVVETDGYRYHRGRVAFENDRDRDLALRAQGFDVIRLSEKQVTEDAGWVAGVLSDALRVGADGSE